MRKYDSYKDSGVEWIGEIPEHWTVGKIKYSDLVIMGQSPLSDECNSEGKGLPFLQGNAEFGELFPTPKLYCETANKSAEINDVLLSVRAPVGAINISNQKVGIGRGLCAVRPIKSNSKFIYYWLLKSVEELDSISTGSTFKAVNLDDVKSLKFPIIGNSEQTTIANYLDHKTTQIDDLIAKKERLIQLLEEERTVMINQVVTKGLDPTVPMKDSGIEWLGEIPEHWEVKKLKYVANLIPQKTSQKPEYVIALENIESWTGKIIGNPFENEMQGEAQLFEKGDVLFNKLRPYLAKVTLADKMGGAMGELLILRPNEFVTSEFLFQRLRSEMVITVVDGSTYGTKMPRASWDKFISLLEFGIPTIKEQNEIVEFISNNELNIDSLSQKYQQEIELLKEYKTALISEVVTGKVDVRNEKLN